MELRDAYFLWLVTGVATLYYPALIFMQEEAMTDFAATVYMKQFDEMSSKDILRPAVSSLPRAPTAMVAQSPYLAESIHYHTQRRMPCVRPLALYVGSMYRPNSTKGGGGGSLLVLCARTRLMMSHSCRGIFREGRRLLPPTTRVRLRLPAGDSDVVHGFSFDEVASTFDATVLFPWNIAVTTFAELYAMHMPMLVPDHLWLARLWPKQMTSYGKAHPNIHAQLKLESSSQHPTPYPSMDFFTKDFAAMVYWAKYYAHIYELPGVSTFTSIPDLLWSVHSGRDLLADSAAMREEAGRALHEVLPFWAGILDLLTDGANLLLEKGGL
eukprot:TRINITY_DN81069_c0_g1_i1.p1 TRINITY_DN81069_c0_g1~~TRINITY_DN81069_c0_g1_i1.p1  ORF type:complete len:326 (+),score=61.62 TRINITY_DN81069_c0_g1_i1:151-1128(+)